VRAKLVAKVVHDMDLVPIVFTGADLCNNQGPMVNPQLLRQRYMPYLKMIAEPMVDAGLRLIYHCDGDVRLLIDDFLAAGFSGLQGFQYELGIDPYEIAKKRDAMGRPLLFFASMCVSRTLPFGTPEDLRDEVDWLHHWTDGGRNMFLFTSNVTGVEVPPENLIAGYQHGHTLAVTGEAAGEKRPWPFTGKM